MRRGTLLAFVIPAVSQCDIITEKSQLEDMSSDLPDANLVNANIRIEGVSFEELKSFQDRLVYVVLKSCDYFTAKSFKEAFKNAMTATVVISTVVVLAFWAASHFVGGVGFAIDAILIAIGWAMIGWGIFSAMRSLLNCLKKTKNATSVAELDEAAKELADTLTQVGIDLLIGLLTRGAGKLRAKTSAKPESGGGSGSAGKSKKEIEADNKAKTEEKKKKSEEEEKPDEDRQERPPDTPDIDEQLDEMYAKAPAGKEEIDNMADELAEKYNGRVAKAPLKGRVRAKQKLVDDYGGNTSKLKDLARNTIVVPKDKIKNVTQDLKDKGGEAWEFSADQSAPGYNTLGYTGVNVTMKTKSGLNAEIQVNSPEMIFAKEPETFARRYIGDDAYDRIAKETGVEGGLGHKYYEEWRVLKRSDPLRSVIEEKSTRYYELFRGNKNG